MRGPRCLARRGGSGQRPWEDCPPLHKACRAARHGKALRRRRRSSMPRSRPDAFQWLVLRHAKCDGRIAHIVDENAAIMGDHQTLTAGSCGAFGGVSAPSSNTSIAGIRAASGCTGHALPHARATMYPVRQHRVSRLVLNVLHTRQTRPYVGWTAANLTCVIDRRAYRALRAIIAAYLLHTPGFSHNRRWRYTQRGV
jgi:hypothetical protein